MSELTLDAWDSASDTQTIDTETLDKLVVEMNSSWDTYEKAKKAASELLAKYEDLEGKVLGLLKAIKKTKYHVDGIGTVSLTSKLVVRTPKTPEEKWAVLTYCMDKYGEEVRDNLISINHQAINSFYNKEAKIASDNGVVDFSLPGVGTPTSVEGLRITPEKK